MQANRLRVYGLIALGLATASALPAQVLTTLYSFCSASGGNCPDGQNAYAGLVEGLDGNLYGTTYQGGTYGGGTVFKVTPGGSLTTLYNFCAVSGCADGQFPFAGLTLALTGNLYGTTQGGGANGYGTVFSITSAGVLTTVYNFCSLSRCADGGYPYAGLFQALNGTFYGTTFIGGHANGESPEGTVFKLRSNGSLTTLYQFCHGFGTCTDGSAPMAGVIQGIDGNLYGTTFTGGTKGGWPAGLGDNGTVFKLTQSGALTTLYNFDNSSSYAYGSWPRAGLVQGLDGNLYGTTNQRGANGNYGAIFKITTGGSITTLYSFCAVSGCLDGANPEGPVIQATDGNFYGTTHFGGANNGGTVFRITPAGTLTTLYSFCAQAACADGQYPYAGLFEATDGILYGTTYQGGTAGMGTVFSLNVGLGPFVKMLPASAAAGDAVNILGTNLTGATRVSFNGAAAAFKVVSDSLITTTLPKGAASGTAKVVTPGRTLLSAR
ncbi:MAG: choice-of-anchor tandem repeat GloVer-containing protein [Bryobacteraceae bacterium]|jgi:uncharacterized repeat protein (TIGR03803 family)